MLSITMAADSTQNEHLHQSKKKSSKRNKHHLRSSSSSSSISDDSNHSHAKRTKTVQVIKESKMKSSDSCCESDLDLSKELLPISGYQNNKEAMIENMFKSISNKKLKTMLPEILQPLSMKELRSLCLEQLHVMSEKRVIKILEGVDPDEISSSGSEEAMEEKITLSHCQEDGGREDVEGPSSGRVDNMVDNPENSGSPVAIKPVKHDPQENNDLSSNKVSSQHVGKRSPKHSEEVELKDQRRSIPQSPCREVSGSLKEHLNAQSSSKDGLSKTQLEILELEMRARAIKAMLKAQEEHERSVERKSLGRERRQSLDRRPSRCRQETNVADDSMRRMQESEHRNDVVKHLAHERPSHTYMDGRSHERTSYRDRYIDDTRRNYREDGYFRYQRDSARDRYDRKFRDGCEDWVRSRMN